MTSLECGGLCYRDEVDVGVGTIHGPWFCLECGWSDQNYPDKLLDGKDDE